MRSSSILPINSDTWISEKLDTWISEKLKRAQFLPSIMIPNASRTKKSGIEHWNCDEAVPSPNNLSGKESFFAVSNQRCFFSWATQQLRIRRTSSRWKRCHFGGQFNQRYHCHLGQWYHPLNVLKIESALIAIPTVYLVLSICRFSHWADGTAVLWSLQDSLHGRPFFCFLRIESDFWDVWLVFGSVVLFTGFIHPWWAIPGFALSHEISWCDDHKEDRALHRVSARRNCDFKSVEVRYDKCSAISIHQRLWIAVKPFDFSSLLLENL